MGLILREDVDAVRERVRIDEVVGEHVTLRPAGVGSLKGLCPFHDERSPSFHVRPQVGRWHCFGCNEGGDVISFVQRIDGLGFTEAVEHLAVRAGVQLRYEEGGGARQREEPGRRQRLLDAHRVASAYYREQLTTPAAAPARDFLAERSFDPQDAERFGVGFAPAGWDALLRHLRGRGFTEAELVASGLVSQGGRGVYDRFRGRLMWPIRDVTGEVIGFGARRLLEDDPGPKYLNTPETALYHKSQVLYGLDLAKREIARRRQVVVVEGYTDVMAAHLSGVETAVATCGTAFGGDHTRVVRRLLGDSGGAGGLQLASGMSVGGEVIFTFDGDAAGQKAALRAFEEDQRFVAQTFVAVAPEGMDPCELRQRRGPEAVRALVESRQPLFEFAIRSTLRSFDLETAEGRVGALRAAAPVVAGIRDAALRPEYARRLAGWLGMDSGPVLDAVRRAASSVRPGAESAGRGPDRRDAAGRGAPAGRDAHAGPGDRGGGPGRAESAPAGGVPMPSSTDPVARLERQVLEVALQYPGLVPAEQFDVLPPDAFVHSVWRDVHAAVVAAGGVGVAAGDPGWLERVLDLCAPALRTVVSQLVVAPVPQDRPEGIERYARGVVRALIDVGLTRQIAEVRGRLQRADPVADGASHTAAFEELVALESLRRELRAQD